jgi:hypothetical protein
MVPAISSARVDIDVEIGPPVAQVEVIPEARVGFVWAPGYYRWAGHEHVWVGGHWIKERRGHHWIADHWDRRGERWHYEPGHWDRD